MQKCVLAADFVFVNNEHLGATAAFRAQIRSRLTPSIDLMQGKTTRRPTADEVHMATAYSQSHGSACIKRRVGAVIVDEYGRALGLGYNENPARMKHCIHEYYYCLKDNNMYDKMGKLHDVRCQGCGRVHAVLEEPWRCLDCKKDMKKQLFPSRNLEICTAFHAEEWAIRSLPNREAPEATMYVTTFPCFQCARYIIEAGIRRVVYVEAYPVKEAINFLESHNVVTEPFSGFKARAFNIIFKGIE